jgi:hypothetical protein
MSQSLKAVAVVSLVAVVATAGYFIARWLGSPHEIAMIFPALCITITTHFAIHMDRTNRLPNS